VITNINCPNCNQSIPPQVDICPHCGTQLRAQAQPDDVEATVIKNNLPDVLKELPDVLKQLESSANINLTIAGALVTFYTTGIFAGKVQASDWWHAALYALPILILLFAIFASLRVFYPRGYREEHDTTALFIEKDRRLQLSSYLLEAAIVVLIAAVFFYLIR